MGMLGTAFMKFRLSRGVGRERWKREVFRKGLLVAVLAAAGLSCSPRGAAPGSARARAFLPHPGVTEAEAGAEARATLKQTVYVPIYPFVYADDNARPLNLAATLYVRNTDASHSIILSAVRYYHTDGRLVRAYVKSPLKIAALASMEFFVKESDVAGGSSASFLVDWGAEGAVSPPVVEALMIGALMNQGIAFTSPGRVVSEGKEGE